MSDELKLRNLFEDTLVIWAEVFVLLLLLFSPFLYPLFGKSLSFGDFLFCYLLPKDIAECLSFFEPSTRGKICPHIS